VPTINYSVKFFISIEKYTILTKALAIIYGYYYDDKVLNKSKKCYEKLYTNKAPQKP